MTTRSLDEATARQVTTIIDRARRAGANVPARLHEAKLIWSKEREKAAEVQGVEDMLAEFKVWLPHEFLRLVNRELVGCTPTDMYNAIHKWMGDYLEHIKRSQ